MHNAMHNGVRKYHAMDIELLEHPDCHDTGFHLDAYLQTEEMPDYFETTSTVNSFYNKTAQHHIDQTRAYFESKNQGDAFESFRDEIMHVPNPAETMSIITDALKQEPSIYTPAETIMAQRYLDPDWWYSWRAASEYG